MHEGYVNFFRDILLLGNLGLYAVCEMVKEDDIDVMPLFSDDIYVTIVSFREYCGLEESDRCPLLGITKRVDCVNSVVVPIGDETMGVWDN